MNCSPCGRRAAGALPRRPAHPVGGEMASAARDRVPSAAGGVGGAMRTRPNASPCASAALPSRSSSSAASSVPASAARRRSARRAPRPTRAPQEALQRRPPSGRSCSIRRSPRQGLRHPPERERPGRQDPPRSGRSSTARQARNRAAMSATVRAAIAALRLLLRRPAPGEDVAPELLPASSRSPRRASRTRRGRPPPPAPASPSSAPCSRTGRSARATLSYGAVKALNPAGDLDHRIDLGWAAPPR